MQVSGTYKDFDLKGFDQTLGFTGSKNSDNKLAPHFVARCRKARVVGITNNLPSSAKPYPKRYTRPSWAEIP
jgi:hypothetical protein